MKLTKFGHACVRLEKDGTILVIDPGPLSGAAAARNANAILITHEHWDHFDETMLLAALAHNPGVEVWTNRAVADRIVNSSLTVHVVGGGDAFAVGGFEIQVHGEYHALTHRDMPAVGNIGFLVDGALLHPGDAFTVPSSPVTALLVPTHAPWMKIGEAIDYVREVHPQRAFALHDGLLNEHGLAVTDRLLGSIDIGTEFMRLAPGHSVDVR